MGLKGRGLRERLKTGVGQIRVGRISMYLQCFHLCPNKFPRLLTTLPLPNSVTVCHGSERWRPSSSSVSFWVSLSRLCLLIVQTVQGTTPPHQYDPTTVIDSFSTLKLDDAILPESDGPPQYTDHTPRVGVSTSTQSGRRGPSLPFSPSQGLPARSPPPQDSVYPNPPHDDSVSYHSGQDTLPNDEQIGSRATHQYWNDSVAYSSDSYGSSDPASQYHQPPHSQAYFQQRKCLK